MSKDAIDYMASEFHGRNMIEDHPHGMAPMGGSVDELQNDGGSAAYYQLPGNAKDLQDLIEYKNMNYARATILKAAYRGGADGNDKYYKRDLNKIIWFANRELKRIGFG